jgi:hypothetical protein
MKLTIWPDKLTQIEMDTALEEAFEAVGIGAEKEPARNRMNWVSWERSFLRATSEFGISADTQARALGRSVHAVRRQREKMEIFSGGVLG